MSNKVVNNQNENKSFAFVPVCNTHGGFELSIPVHTIKGKNEGPTLLIQAGLSGLEVEPALYLPQIVKEIDPELLSGVLMVVPLLNMSGFEFEQVNTMWDNKDLHDLGQGKVEGSISEKLLASYYHNYVSKADMVLEIRTGAQWSYGHYSQTYATAEENTIDIAIKTGLPYVLTDTPFDNSLLAEAAKNGIANITAWIGGGPGLRDYRASDEQFLRNTVFNTLKTLNMLSGEPTYSVEEVIVTKHLCTIKDTKERGMVFMNQALKGKDVEMNQEIGYVRHPFSGETIEQINAPVNGVILDTGAAWPVLPEDTTLAIIGERSKTYKIVEGELC